MFKITISGTISKYKVNAQMTAPGTDVEGQTQPVAVKLTQVCVSNNNNNIFL